MQNTSTGDLVELDPELFRKDIQAAKDAVLQREFQGPVFTVGEVLEIKGGKFRVHSIRSRGRLILKGIPL